jgi:hypothetical protein
LSYLLRLFAAGATANAQATIRSGSAMAEIGCPNQRLKYRLDFVSMPQQYRAAVRRFLGIGSRCTGIVWHSVWRQQAEGAADRGQRGEAAGAVAEVYRLGRGCDLFVTCLSDLLAEWLPPPAQL